MIRKKAYIFIKFNYAAWLRLALWLLILPISTPTRFFTIEKPSIFFENIATDANLQADVDALLPLFDEMPPVPVYLSDEPVLKSGSSIERGVAYTQCEKNERPVVFVKKNFYEKTNRKQLVNILKHELTHAWLCRQNLMSGHDEIFRRKFSQVGGFGN
jgi:hypothetical protein